MAGAKTHPIRITIVLCPFRQNRISITCGGTTAFTTSSWCWAIMTVPVKPGQGSAIFLHVAREGYGPSAGCVTLALPDLLDVLQGADTSSAVDVRGVT